MLKRYGLFLGVVLVFLVACGGAETAVHKDVVVLAEKQIVVEVVPAEATALVEILDGVLGDGDFLLNEN